MSLQIIHDGTVIFDDDVTEIRMSENVHGELKLEASFEPVKCAVDGTHRRRNPVGYQVRTEAVGTEAAGIGTAALAETLGVKFI